MMVRACSNLPPRPGVLPIAKGLNCIYIRLIVITISVAVICIFLNYSLCYVKWRNAIQISINLLPYTFYTLTCHAMTCHAMTFHALTFHVLTLAYDLSPFCLIFDHKVDQFLVKVNSL